MTRGDIGIEIGPAAFRNPVMLASGPAGYGTEYAGIVDIAAAGAVVTKTISLEPRPGNPGQRLRVVVLNEPKPDLLQHEAQALVEGRADSTSVTGEKH